MGRGMVRGSEAKAKAASPTPLQVAQQALANLSASGSSMPKAAPVVPLALPAPATAAPATAGLPSEATAGLSPAAGLPSDGLPAPATAGLSPATAGLSPATAGQPSLPPATAGQPSLPPATAGLSPAAAAPEVVATTPKASGPPAEVSTGEPQERIREGCAR